MQALMIFGLVVHCLVFFGHWILIIAWTRMKDRKDSSITMERWSFWCIWGLCFMALAGYNAYYAIIWLINH